MANGRSEVMTPDGGAEEERGIKLAELYANSYTPDGELRTTPTEPGYVPEQRLPTHDALPADVEEQLAEPPVIEGGKALYGTFDSRIRFAGGVSVKGAIRGREIVRMNRRMGARQLGGYVLPRVLPGGR